MTYFAQKFLNSFVTYSPPLSILRTFTFLSIYFSALNSKNLENVSSFFRMKKIQHFHEKSSIKMIKYLCLVMEAVEKGPPTSKWILSRAVCAFLSRSWKLDFMYFPKVHPLHTSYYSKCSFREAYGYLLNNLQGTMMKMTNSFVPKFTFSNFMHLL